MGMNSEFDMSKFFKRKVARGEMRKATPLELKDNAAFCRHPWHDNPLSIRCGTCPGCGQRLEGWLYENL